METTVLLEVVVSGDLHDNRPWQQQQQQQLQF